MNINYDQFLKIINLFFWKNEDDFHVASIYGDSILCSSKTKLKTFRFDYSEEHLNIEIFQSFDKDLSEEDISNIRENLLSENHIFSDLKIIGFSENFSKKKLFMVEDSEDGNYLSYDLKYLSNGMKNNSFENIDHNFLYYFDIWINKEHIFDFFSVNSFKFQEKSLFALFLYIHAWNTFKHILNSKNITTDVSLLSFCSTFDNFYDLRDAIYPSYPQKKEKIKIDDFYDFLLKNHSKIKESNYLDDDLKELFYMNFKV